MTSSSVRRSPTVALPELENVIGPFVNSLALRVNLAENPTFNEFLSQVRQVTTDAIDNREIPFDLVVEAVNPLRTLGHAPIFQVMLALHNFPIQEPRVGELNCTIVRMGLAPRGSTSPSIW